MEYLIVNSIEDFAYKLLKRNYTLNYKKPYSNKYGSIILVKCNDIDMRNKLLTMLIRDGFNFKGVSNKNSLWIKLIGTDVYLETTKSLFIENDNANYDEIYMRTKTKKFVKMLKDHNIGYKYIIPFYLDDDLGDDLDAFNDNDNQHKEEKDNVIEKYGEKSKKVIPDALKGLEVSDDLHSFTYKLDTNDGQFKLDYYTSDEIDKDKLEELIRKLF